MVFILTVSFYINCTQSHQNPEVSNPDPRRQLMPGSQCTILAMFSLANSFVEIGNKFLKSESRVWQSCSVCNQSHNLREVSMFCWCPWDICRQFTVLPCEMRLTGNRIYTTRESSGWRVIVDLQQNNSKQPAPSYSCFWIIFHCKSVYRHLRLQAFHKLPFLTGINQFSYFIPHINSCECLVLKHSLWTRQSCRSSSYWKVV